MHTNRVRRHDARVRVRPPAAKPTLKIGLAAFTSSSYRGGSPVLRADVKPGGFDQTRELPIGQILHRLK